MAALAPVPGSKVFLTSGGSDSIDTATKMARHYWQLRGEPERTVLIRREKAYHGMHTAGTSLAGIPANAGGHGELIEDVVEVPWDDAPALRAAIEGAGEGRVAAFFCEPVIGAGGVFPPPPGYLAAVRDICRDTGVLFVADEVITGFGRCGDWFASSRFGLEPDIVTCAKGITSGYLPMGAVLAAPQVAEPFWATGAGMWRHGYTYSGHAAVAAAALANLDILEREDLCGRALALEGPLAGGARVAERSRAGAGDPRRDGRAGGRPASARPGRGRRGAAGARRRRMPPRGSARAAAGGRRDRGVAAAGDRRRRPGGAHRGVPRRPRRQSVTPSGAAFGRYEKECPQAQELCAAGLSIVNPDCSRLSTKSIVACVR